MYARMMEGCKKCASVKQLRQATAVLKVQQRCCLHELASCGCSVLWCSFRDTCVGGS